MFIILSYVPLVVVTRQATYIFHILFMNKNKRKKLFSLFRAGCVGESHRKFIYTQNWLLSFDFIQVVVVVVVAI